LCKAVGGKTIKSEETLKELVDYIAVLKDYYMTVLSEEKTDYNKAFIKGKLNVLEDIGKRLKKMDKAK
jgi:hypothetical protein